ncbi:hypothetical protein Salat_2902400, partial [Sesamum alatum]
MEGGKLGEVTGLWKEMGENGVGLIKINIRRGSAHIVNPRQDLPSNPKESKSLDAHDNNPDLSQHLSHEPRTRRHSTHTTTRSGSAGAKWDRPNLNKAHRGKPLAEGRYNKFGLCTYYLSGGKAWELKWWGQRSVVVGGTVGVARKKSYVA